MVVGHGLVVEVDLAGLLGGNGLHYLDLRTGTGAVGPAYPALLVGSGGSACLGVDQDGETGAVEARMAHVCAPCEGVAVVDGVVYDCHELVDREVPGLVPAPVVFNLDCELGIERMMGEAGQGHIVGRVDLEGVAIAGGSVLLAVHNELRRLLAQILVQNCLNGPLPCGAESPVGVLHDCVHHGFEDSVHLSGDRQLGAVVQAGHFHVGNDTVVADDIQDVVTLGTDGIVELAVQADVLDRPLVVGVADHEELGEIGIFEGVGDLVDTDGLGLDESYSGEAPAGAAAVLVLH